MILAKSAHNAKFVTFKVLEGCMGVVSVKTISGGRAALFFY